MGTLAFVQENVSGKKSRKVNFVASETFVLQLSQVAKEKKVNLSDFIREACLRYIMDYEQLKAEAELIEACKNSRDFNKKFAAGWAEYETEIP